MCDFNLSRFNTQSNVGTLAKCRGTFAYIAPEVYNCQGYTVKSDTYSMGLVLWEIFNSVLRGKYFKPFQEYPHLKLDMQILIQACTKDLRPTIPEPCPKEIQTLLIASWHQNPANRPDSTQQLDLLKKIQEDFNLKPHRYNLALLSQNEEVEDKKTPKFKSKRVRNLPNRSSPHSSAKSKERRTHTIEAPSPRQSGMTNKVSSPRVPRLPGSPRDTPLSPIQRKPRFRRDISPL